MKGSIIPQYLYNAYGEDLDGQYNFAESFAKVDLMFADMAMQLNRLRNKVSRLLVCGWDVHGLE